MSFKIHNKQSELIATFEEYSDAVACLPAMSRILKEILKMDASSYERLSSSLPGGCIAYKTVNERNIIEARP